MTIRIRYPRPVVVPSPWWQWCLAAAIPVAVAAVVRWVG